MYRYVIKANWIGHSLRRNCLLKHVIEGKIKGQIEVKRRQGRRRKKLLDDLKDRRGYCELKEEALDRTMWRNRFARGFGPVVLQFTDDDDDDDDDDDVIKPHEVILVKLNETGNLILLNQSIFETCVRDKNHITINVSGYKRRFE